VTVASTSIEVLAGSRLSVVDLTDDLRRAIKDSGVTDGCAVAFCAHTTCVLMINELEDGAIEDIGRTIEALVPVDGYYAHDDMARRTQNLTENERINGAAHVGAMLLGGSAHPIPVTAGEPLLGEWQRLMLLELDEPKARTITFQVFGD
jgi:secondary thiamine-phosphate synthase enzyme